MLHLWQNNKLYQTICHLITNKSITSYPYSYSYCKRPQRESIKKFCEFNIKICDSNIIVTCNSYKNVRLYLLQNVIFLKYANFFFFVLTNEMQKSFQKFDFFLIYLKNWGGNRYDSLLSWNYLIETLSVQSKLFQEKTYKNTFYILHDNE